MKEIDQQSAVIADLISGIADRSNEQSSAIEQINAALELIKDGALQNMAETRLLASAATDLESQAQLLENQTDRFVLSGVPA